MFSRMIITMLLLSLLLLAGCTQTTIPPNVETASPPAEDNATAIEDVPTPDANTSVMTGQVVSNTDQAPIRETVVQLAQVHRDEDTGQAVFALDLAHAPGTWTDENGAFTFSNLEPGEYVLVVGDYYGENDIVREPNGDARVFKAEAGNVLNVGVVQVKPNISPGR